jgi:hypothetical protein
MRHFPMLRFLRSSMKHTALLQGSVLTVLAYFCMGDSGGCGSGSSSPGTQNVSILLHCQCHCRYCANPSGVLACADGNTRCFSHIDDGFGFNYIRTLNYCGLAPANANTLSAIDATTVISTCDEACSVQVGSDMRTTGGCASGDGTNTLDGVDDHASDFVQINGCNPMDSYFSPSCDRVLDVTGSHGFLVSSQSTLSFDGNTGSLTGTSATVAFDASLGKFSVDSFLLTSVSANIDGNTVSNIQILSPGFGGGILSGTSFVIPKANITAYVTAQSNGPQSFTVTADSDLTGTYDPVAKTWSLDGSLSGAGADVTLHLQGNLTSIAPLISLDRGQTVECDLNTGLGTADLDASIQNPEGDGVGVSWADVTNTPGTLLGTGPTISVQLPLGAHTIRENATSAMNAETAAFTTVTVVHTLPPLLTPASGSPFLSACSLGAPVKVPLPTIADACSPNTTLNGSVTEANRAPASIPVAADGTVTVGPGPIVVTWTATDASGLQSKITQQFTVVPSPTVYGFHSAKIDDRAQVVLPGGGGFGVLESGGGAELDVSATVGATFSAGNVFLANNSTINGNLLLGGSLTEQAGARITGTIATGSPSLSPFPSLAPFHPGTTTVLLQPNTTQSLPPGSYGSVTLNQGAILTLNSGTYVFASLDLEPGSALTFNSTTGPLDINIASSVIFRGSIQDANANPGALMLQYSGGSQIFIETPIAGTVVAPNAGLVIGGGAGTYRGSFIGQSVEVRPDVTVIHHPFGCP